MKQTKIWSIYSSVSENTTSNQSNNEKTVNPNLGNHERVNLNSFTPRGFPLLLCLKFVSTLPYTVCFLHLFWDFACVHSVTVLSISCSAQYLRMNSLLPFHRASGSIWSMGSKCGKLGGGVWGKEETIISLLLLYLWLHLLLRFVCVGSSITKLP